MYDPQIDGQRYTFGVSGLLYKRNLLLYDRETESLWSQLRAQGVAGPLTGTRLRLLPVTHTTWPRWKQEHPDTLVLSFQTGYRRDYARDPYRDFPFDHRPALVVTLNGTAKIYPFSELKKAASLLDEVAGQKVIIEFDTRTQTARARTAAGELLPGFVAFFADARAFHPDAPVFKAK